ncbi:MAG: nucleotidyltransferase domain-containing protein, partial [Anaerolineales bacterium]|nr:nucleotidyltransferase domain-containing protein [Anaerolineales bacterium]
MSIKEIRQKISPILEKYGVVKAALFGSTVRGTATERSDIDLLVKLPNNASLLDLAGLKIELEEKLGEVVPFTVEILSACDAQAGR